MGSNDEPTTDEPNDRQTDITASVEYRPGVWPLVVTLDVPEHVLESAGGFEELTETVEYRRATDE